MCLYGAGHGACEFVDEFRQLGISSIVGRRDDYRVAQATASVSGTRKADQAVLKRARGNLLAQTTLVRKRRLRHPITDKLYADKIAASAHIADLRKPAQRISQSCLERFTAGTHPSKQRIALDNALHCKAGGTGGGVAGIRMPGQNRSVR